MYLFTLDCNSAIGPRTCDALFCLGHLIYVYISKLSVYVIFKELGKDGGFKVQLFLSLNPLVVWLNLYIALMFRYLYYFDNLIGILVLGLIDVFFY